jgi:2,3-diketo-5-methylthio-1-phosphopentane phosphatase
MESSRKVIFFDFDGTLTSEDTLDVFFEKHVNHLKLRELASLWESGFIGSKKCLTDLFNLSKHVNNESIEWAVNSVNLPKHTIELLRFLRREQFDIYIVSDGVDLIIHNFLRKHGIFELFDFIYSNSLHVLASGYTFNQNNSKENICTHAQECALCKSSIVNEVKKKYPVDTEFYYVGDGTSDIFGAEQCQFVFARDSLYKILRHQNKMNYSDFSEIINFFNTQYDKQ